MPVAIVVVGLETDPSKTEKIEESIKGAVFVESQKLGEGHLIKSVDDVEVIVCKDVPSGLECNEVEVLMAMLPREKERMDRYREVVRSAVSSCGLVSTFTRLRAIETP